MDRDYSLVDYLQVRRYQNQPIVYHRKGRGLQGLDIHLNQNQSKDMGFEDVYLEYLILYLHLYLDILKHKMYYFHFPAVS